MTDKVGTALLDMTVGIVANYVAHNRIGPESLPSLITSTHAALANAGSSVVVQEEAVEKPSTAQVRRSISDAGLTSFIDGKIYQSLRRHLTTHGFTPESYRATFGLRSDYPMVSPAYSAKRSALAKALGLGQGGHKSKGSGDGVPKRGRRPKASA